jgi:hypothetical protein
MTQENLVSPLLAQWDAQPISMLSSGEGAAGVMKTVDDYVSVTASGITTLASTYRLCRFPTFAKIKSVIIDLPILENDSATAVFDINVAFSDNPYDGTPALLSGAALNGLTTLTATCIPTTGQTGNKNALTSITGYTNPNKLFGSITVGNNAVKLNNQVLFNGAYAAGSTAGFLNTAWNYSGPTYPLYEFLGFQNSQGYPADPGGWMDLLLYVSTAATGGDGVAGMIHARVDYVI